MQLGQLLGWVWGMDRAGEHFSEVFLCVAPCSSTFGMSEAPMKTPSIFRGF